MSVNRILMKLPPALFLLLLLIGGCAAPASPGDAANAVAKPVGTRPSTPTPPAQARPYTAQVSANTPLPIGITPAPTEVEMLKSKDAVKIDKSQFQKAAPIYSSTWINSPPLSLESMRGKVLVVDFWTFACYNCQNTLPYFKAWDQKYRDQGLVIIGVHTPELSIERDIENVEQAVSDEGIRYPIAIDGDYANWNRYGVRAWPTWFIVDKEGYIRYSHIGEGDYTGSEATIQQLLVE